MFRSCNKCMQGRYQHASQSHADRSFEFPVTVGPPVRVLALLHLTSMQPRCWGASTVWKPELHHWCCCWCFVCLFMLVLMYLIIFTLLGTIYLNSSDRETSRVKMGNHLFRVKIHSLMYHNLIFFTYFLFIYSVEDAASQVNRYVTADAFIKLQFRANAARARAVSLRSGSVHAFWQTMWPNAGGRRTCCSNPRGLLQMHCASREK